MSIDPEFLAAWQTLNRAIRADDLSAVRVLINQHPEFLGDLPELGSALILAAKLGKLEIVKCLVENGANVNQVHRAEDSPLSFAAMYGRVNVIEYLIEHGVILEVKSLELNPLLAAIHDGHLNVAKLLIVAGIDCHAVYKLEGGKLRNALSFAKERGQTEIVNLLLKAGCRMPVQGVDKPTWDAENTHIVVEKNTGHEQFRRLMSEVFGPVDPLVLQEIVPIQRDVHVDINVIPPNDRSPHWILFTTGMSDRPMNVPRGQEDFQFAELIMQLPVNWPDPRDKAHISTFWPCQWLRQIAYFPHLQNTWLGGPLTIISSDDPPIPLGPNTKQTCLLLAAKENAIVLNEERRVRLYTVTPIFTEERDFEKKHGIRALVQRFKDRGYGQVVDVNRPSVVD